MISKITEILKENGIYSLTRIISVVGFIAFLAGSAYLMYRGLSWTGYDTFASLTGGGGAATQVVNKFINSRYNSSPGESPKTVNNAIKKEGE
jgi:hypothetical protein